MDPLIIFNVTFASLYSQLMVKIVKDKYLGYNILYNKSTFEADEPLPRCL
jgi:hypothetical protein